MKNKPRFFLDTSALIALFNRLDQFHVAIQNYLQNLAQPISGVTSNLVLVEFLTFFSRHGALSEALQFHEKLLNDARFKIIWVDQALHGVSSEILRKFSDQQISFTDASSFAIMKKEHLTHALAFDEDFTRAGFVKVP